MKIEEFKNLCKVKIIEESIQKKNLIEKYNKLKEEQFEYGESYRPIPDEDLHSCPNCKNRLNRKSVPDNGFNNKFIYMCECGYEYAW